MDKLVRNFYRLLMLLSGLSMLAELALQLRGEAGPRQVKGAEIALAENGGGVIGMEEAVASVVILQKI